VQRRLLPAGRIGRPAFRAGRRGLFHRPWDAPVAGVGRTAYERGAGDMKITGAAKLAGIVGRPVVHSLSPVIQNAWIEAAGMDAVYAAFAPPDEAAFDLLVQAGRAGMIHGLNVTAPFKGQALACADQASDTARACGSANVLAFRDGRVKAHSTDGEGLLKALAEQAPDFNLTAGPVLFLGAGGA